MILDLWHQFTEWWVHLRLETILVWLTGGLFLVFVGYILFRGDDDYPGRD